MEPVIPDLRQAPRVESWNTLLELQKTLLEGSSDTISGMATTSALIHNAFSNLWTGFYRVMEPGDHLIVGPYQGTLGCLEIKMGKGVCGTAAQERRTIIVPDVNAFPGHISCDARSRSEIVVPVFDFQDRVIAVLDIDSEQPSAFNETDAVGIEAMMEWFRVSSKRP